MKTLWLLPLLFLMACATPQAGSDGSPGTDPLLALQQITVADLTQASVIANAGGDLVGAACYDALAKHIGSGKAGIPQVKGVFSVFEAARLGVSKFRSGIPQDVHIACAPVVLDAQHTLIRLGIIGGGATILGPVAPLLVR